MNRSPTAVLVAVALAISGCGAAGGTTPPTSTTLTTTAPTTTTTSTPVRTPVATLASTTEKASQAPAGAIPVMMISLSNAAPRFEPDHITAGAGTVVFFLENMPGTIFKPDHNMLIGPAIGQALARTPSIRLDQAVTFTVNDLTPGSYVFWCSVKDIGNLTDHAGEGMVGTLTITP